MSSATYPSSVGGSDLTESPVIEPLRARLDDLLSSETSSIASMLEVGLSRPGKLLAAEPRPRWAELTAGCFAVISGRSASLIHDECLGVELLRSGLDVLDDLADGEVGGWAEATDESQLLNLSTLLLARAWSLIAIENSHPSIENRKLGVIRRSSFLLAQATRGQADRLAVCNSASPVSPERATAIAELRSGCLGRLAAQVGAGLATDDETIVLRYGELGENLATYEQINNDLHDVRPRGAKRGDLATGTPTLPLAYASQELGKQISILSIEEVAASGGIAFAWTTAKAYLARARELATELDCVKELELVFPTDDAQDPA